MVCKLQLEVKISFTERTDRNMSLYYSGRGLSPYLHLRNYETSSTDNDGASKIFASSSHSTMSDQETDASPILSLPRTFSYMSTFSSFTWSDTASISTTRNMFQYSTSSTERSIDAYMSKLKVEFNYSTIASAIQQFNYCPQKVKKKAFHYQCFPENLTKGFSSVGSSNLMLILINY